MAWRITACASWLFLAGAACGDEDDRPLAPPAGLGGQGGLPFPALDPGPWRGLTAQGTALGFEVEGGAVIGLDLVWRLGPCETRQSVRFERPLPVHHSSLSVEIATERGDSRARFEVAFAGGDRALGVLTWTTAMPHQPTCSGSGEAAFTASPVAKGGEALP